MSLRRLLGLSAATAAVSGSLRRSLTTSSATHPPWVMINGAAAVVTAPTAYVPLAEPPRVSNLYLPRHLLKISPRPDPDGDVVQGLAGGPCASSGDGLLLLAQIDLRCLTKQGAGGKRILTGKDPDQDPADAVTRFVFNPLTRQLSHLPGFVSDPVAYVCASNMGILTQTDRGHGPPDRFAVADLQGHQMLRFLSETGEWEMVALPRRVRSYFLSPLRYQLPVPRRMEVNQEALAFGGRLWWVDLTLGAVSVDPFSNKPELCFLELPSGSVLPPPSERDEDLRVLSDAEATVLWTQAPTRFRRVGVSQGRLRYLEVSQDDPFLLSSFVFDEEGCGWTLEHRVALSKLLADGGYLSRRLQTRGSARIVVIDPLNASVVHLEVAGQVVVVDMNREQVIGNCANRGNDAAANCIPCVLPPWLGSSRIPISAGKKGVEKNKTLADVLVRSDNK